MNLTSFSIDMETFPDYFRIHESLQRLSKISTLESLKLYNISDKVFPNHVNEPDAEFNFPYSVVDYSLFEFTTLRTLSFTF